eukprot:TRINITY_DN1785_c0_g1_i3.p1 TRINITY_DN1785_c0_g1~~TRINITY_DN1785_c0_g1_i3.p1  ORF type:complete len:475 (-),score=30.53 TRINITY_DN1785_c0_g1_i3:96-1520(-)
MLVQYTSRGLGVGVVFFLLAVAVWSPATAQIPGHRISWLPWAQSPGNSLVQYSGYINVSPATPKKDLFYWLVEYGSHASQKPIILWLNGGPGCSSIGYGLFEEIGPWRPSEYGGGLQYNDQGWHNWANLLFLDQPAGTGFSRVDTAYVTDDSQAVADIYIFLQKFLSSYPYYQGRIFYIAGESYAGHYVFNLGTTILNGNLDPSKINVPLKGIIAGNPLLDVLNDIIIGEVEAAFGLGYINRTIHDALSACYESIYYGPSNGPPCDTYAAVAQAQVGVLDPDNVNGYSCNVCNQYGKPCSTSGTTNYHHSQNLKRGKSKTLRLTLTKDEISRRHMEEVPDKASKTDSASSQRRELDDGFLWEWGDSLPTTVANGISNPGCIDMWVYNYLNRPQVIRAIHADVLGPSPYDFTVCTLPGNPMTYNSSSYANSQLGTIQYLLSQNINIFIQSWVLATSTKISKGMHANQCRVLYGLV